MKNIRKIGLPADVQSAEFRKLYGPEKILESQGNGFPNRPKQQISG
jgi:hypothetical protein